MNLTEKVILKKKKMCHLKLLLVIAIIVFSASLSHAKPYHQLTRHKRTSDQRLAELETLIALAKMNGKLVTIPIGFGKVDPNKIGRRRRSVNILLQQLIKDLSLPEEKTSHEISKRGLRNEEDGGEDLRPEDFSTQEESLLNDKLRILSYLHTPVRLIQ